MNALIVIRYKINIVTPLADSIHSNFNHIIFVSIPLSFLSNSSMKIDDVIHKHFPRKVSILIKPASSSLSPPSWSFYWFTFITFINSPLCCLRFAAPLFTLQGLSLITSIKFINKMLAQLVATAAMMPLWTWKTQTHFACLAHIFHPRAYRALD